MATNSGRLLTTCSLDDDAGERLLRKLFFTATKDAMKTKAQSTETTTTKERKGARSAGFQYLPATKQLTHPTAAPIDADARNVARRNSGMLMSERMAPWLSST